MSPLNSLILGLGLFFLGLQLVGQNLRQLSGGGFRHLVRSFTHTPFRAAFLGVAAGALMQSATAVTFILVSMLGSGAIQTASARIILVWCNVGLTALAFLATLDTHPFVAYFVGGAGIVMGSVRKKPWNTIAGALLGVGMILFALGQMSGGAASWKDSLLFRTDFALALQSPLLGFMGGIGIAALLQSNTGAAMLIIALYGAGALPMEAAIPIVYGTNLGAIALRAFLSSGMTGDSLRLVRMEDLFCIASGILMMIFFFLEKAGIPLVAALAHAVSGIPSVQMATVFFLSNFLPAMVLTPLLPQCARFLKRIWPSDPTPAPNKPAFLTTQALSDPSTALDLIPKELARLLACINLDSTQEHSLDPETRVPVAFQELAVAIEKFCARLASEIPLNTEQSLRLQRLRAGLHTTRHIGEAAAEFTENLADLPTEAAHLAGGLRDALQKNLTLAIQATTSFTPPAIADFLANTKIHALELQNLNHHFISQSETFAMSTRMALAILGDSFEIAIWLIHRLAKLESRIVSS